MKDMKAERQRQLWRFLFAIAALWTAWVSLIPVQALPPVHVWDKVAHAATYAVLTLLLVPSLSPPRAWVAGGWVMLYGVAIEFAQALGGYRHGEWQDALANLVGILFAAAVWTVIRFVRIRLRRRLK